MSIDGESHFIVPPPGIALEPAEPKPIEPEPVADGDLITLPPGIADSATYRMPAQRPPKPDDREDAAPVFFPSAGIGTTQIPASVSPPQEMDDATRVVVGRRSAPAWRLTLPDGQQILVEQTTLVGRDPAQNEQWPDALLLPISDEAKTVSKTHAALALTANGQLTVHDLDSTNGVFVAYPGSSEEMVEPGEPTVVEHGAELSFGQFTVAVERS
jgi:hypothetical protein